MKKSKLKIIPFENNDNLNEIYQTSKITFAFLSAPKDGNKQCHPFVKCRDFLQDAIRTMLTGNTSKIYGFEYDKIKNPPIDLRKTRLLIKNNALEEKKDDVILKAEKLIHHYENMLNIPFTAVIKCDDAYVFNGSNFWQFSPTMISLYTLFIRLAEYELDFELYNDTSLDDALNKLINSDSTTNEITYLRTIKPFINIIFRNSHYIFISTLKYDSIYFKEIPVGTFHNNSGVVSLCTAKNSGQLYNDAYKRLQNVLIEDAENIIKLPIVSMPKYSGLYNFPAYSSTQTKFGIAEQKEDINNVNTIFVSCREQLTTALGTILKTNELNKYSLIMTLDGLVNDTIAMIEIKPKVFFAKRVINFIEATYGMKKTAMSTVCLAQEKSKVKHFGWLFHCSDEWMNSPVMLSLFTLIIRTVIKYGVLSEKIYKKITDDVINEICKFKKENASNTINKDFETFSTHFKSVDTVLKNRKVLFFNESTKQDNYYVSQKKIEELKKQQLYKSTSCTLGMEALIKGTHIDNKLVLKYKELHNEK